MADDAQIYVPSARAGRFYQGEIFSNLIEARPSWVEDGSYLVNEVIHPFAVLVSQDCDLEAHERAQERPEGDPSKHKSHLLNLLFVVAQAFAEGSRQLDGGSRTKDMVLLNKVERFHYLSAVGAGTDGAALGLPAMILDFKRIFTFAPEELAAAVQRGETKRHARLATPYAEQLSDRFGYFVQRIGLPTEHPKPTTG